MQHKQGKNNGLSFPYMQTSGMHAFIWKTTQIYYSMTMQEIGKETRNSIRKLCRRLTLEFPKAKWDGSLPYMDRVVPDADDIYPLKPEAEYITLFGDYYWAYHKAFSELRKEKALEYMKDRDLKDSFWRFICEIIAGYQAYRNPKELREKINGFLSSILKPIVDYEVLVPISHLSAKSPIKIGNVVIRKFDPQELEEWGVTKEHPAFAKIANETIAIIPEEGNNPSLVCQRARRKADLAIRVLQTSLSTSRFLHDEQTLYKQGKFIFCREGKDPSKSGYGWKRGYEPVSLTVEEGLLKGINSFLHACRRTLS